MGDSVQFDDRNGMLFLILIFFFFFLILIHFKTEIVQFPNAFAQIPNVSGLSYIPNHTRSMLMQRVT